MNGLPYLLYLRFVRIRFKNQVHLQLLRLQKNCGKLCSAILGSRTGGGNQVGPTFQADGDFVNYLLMR